MTDEPKYPDSRSRKMMMEGNCSKGNGVNSYDPETRTAEVMISTGASVERVDPWSGERWHEVLSITPQSIRLGRLNNGAPLLDAHDYAGGIDAMLGAVLPGTARVENGQLIAKVKFSRSAKGERIAQDLMDGIPISVSTGYKTHREQRDARSQPEVRTAVDWEPLEVSVAPIPAEAGAAFRQHQVSRALPTPQEGTVMSKDDVSVGNGADETKKETIVDTKIETRAEPVVANNAPELMAIGREAKLPFEVIEEAIKRNTSPDEFRKIAISEMAKRDRVAPISATQAPSMTVVRDENAGRVEAMSEALLTRVLSSRREPAIRTSAQAEWAKMRGKVDLVGRALLVIDGHEKPVYDRTRDYLGMGFVEIAAECLGHRGHIRNPAQGYDIVQRAFHTTSDFPGIFENVLNKALLARYQLAMPTYRQIAAERQFGDFRPHPQLRAGDFPLPVEITETGEIKSGTAGESKETVSVKPYGIMFSISRHMIVNDELGAIDQMLGSAGDTVLVFENTTFYTMLNSNSGVGPQLNQDSYYVFNTAVHKNYLSSGSGVPSVASIGVARAAMRAQKSINGYYLNVPPAIILTGPAQETVADQMVTSITPALTTSVNPFSGKLRSVSDANITDTSWYLFAEPSQLPNFVYGFLNGATGPRIRTEEPFGMQGVRVSMEHDFGCGAIDFRGTYKNNGAS